MATADFPTAWEGPCWQRALALSDGGLGPTVPVPGWLGGGFYTRQHCRPLLNPAPEAYFLGHQPWTKSPCKTAGNSPHLQTAHSARWRPHTKPRGIVGSSTQKPWSLCAARMSPLIALPKATKGCLNLTGRFVQHGQGNQVCPSSLPTDLPTQSQNPDNDICGVRAKLHLSKDSSSLLHSGVPKATRRCSSISSPRGTMKSLLMNDLEQEREYALVIPVSSEKLQSAKKKKREEKRDCQLPWNMWMKITAQWPSAAEKGAFDEKNGDDIILQIYPSCARGNKKTCLPTLHSVGK